MSMTANTSRPRPRGNPWFGLLGGGIAWTVHLLAAYGAAEFGCVSGWGKNTYLGMSFVAWLVIALTLITAMFATLATAVAYANCRKLQEAYALENDKASEQYLAHVGALMSSLFLLAIAFETIPILYYLRDC